MPCGEDIEMTPEEQDDDVALTCLTHEQSRPAMRASNFFFLQETWLQEKSAELEALMPLTDQEFLDEARFSTFVE